MSLIRAEYIWIDGNKPTATLRSKTKILDGPTSSLEDVPLWGFDGSSTMQAEGHDSDRLLRPIYYVPDPIRRGDNILVMNEVRLPDGSVHESNTRLTWSSCKKSIKTMSPGSALSRSIPFFEAARPWVGRRGAIPRPRDRSIAVLVPMRSLAGK